MKRTWFIRVICLISILVLTLGNMPVLADEQDNSGHIDIPLGHSNEEDELDEVSMNNAIPIEENISYEAGNNANYVIYRYYVTNPGYFRIFTEGNADTQLTVYSYSYHEALDYYSYRRTYYNDDYSQDHLNYNAEVCLWGYNSDVIFIKAELHSGSRPENFNLKISGLYTNMYFVTDGRSLSNYGVYYEARSSRNTEIEMKVHDMQDNIHPAGTPVTCRWIECDDDGNTHEYENEKGLSFKTIPLYSPRNCSTIFYKLILNFDGDPHNYTYYFRLIYDDFVTVSAR